MDTVLDTSDIVFEDKSNVDDEEDAYISVSELIVVLENETIHKDCEIKIVNGNTGAVEKLTMVYKCGEGCSALHLVTGYEQKNFLNN